MGAMTLAARTVNFACSSLERSYQKTMKPLSPNRPRCMAVWQSSTQPRIARGCLVTIITLTLLLTGCGTRADAPTPTPDTAPPPAASPSPTLPPIVIGTVNPTVTLVAPPQPTSTLAPTRTPTPTSAPLQVPVLESPASGSSASGRVTFRWSWNGPALTSNQGFDLRIWKEGQADHFSATEPVRTTSVTVDLNQTAGVRQGGGGDYLWTVAVVQVSPYKRIGKEAPPRTLTIGGVPPTPSRSAAPLIAPDTLQRFAAAGGILSGSLLLAWLYLGGGLEAWLRRARRW